MLIHVLGSAAGGGFPQWNCACANCAGVRAGTLNARPRTQSSIALSVAGERWLLCNASPDVRVQLEAFAPLAPKRTPRDTGLAAVLLMDAQIDHVTGLLMLREHTAPLPVYCTAPVSEDLRTGLPLFGVLGHYCGVTAHELPLDGQALTLPGLEGLRFTAVPLASKAPPYSPHRTAPHPGDNIGLWVEDEASGGRLFYAPGLGAIEPHLWPYLERASLLLVDGTFWFDDEMARAGIGPRRAAEMGHLALAGPGGLIEQLRPLRARKVLIHINNTNPILVEDSPERARLAAEGIEVAHDGMDFTL